jgi:hypothetical protein
MGAVVSPILPAAFVLLLALEPRAAQAENFFVITATFDSQRQAQNAAAETGGWVLDTDIYSALTPDLFAVVRGPFSTDAAAKAELQFLSSSRGYQGAYVKAAGAPRFPMNPLQAALFGEVSIELEDRPGGTNPCEPQEPYQSIKLSHAGVTRRHDQASDTFPIVAERLPIDLGGFSVIKRTGELQLMRACFE